MLSKFDSDVLCTFFS